jgi:hypothetical protein
MANELATQKTATELLVQAADELSGGSMGQILKFSKGKYFVGDKEIAVNSELIAHVTQLARGWVKFKGGELVDRRIGKVVDGFVVPERDALDATDKSEWEKDDRGDPRDPRGWPKCIGSSERAAIGGPATASRSRRACWELDAMRGVLVANRNRRADRFRHRQAPLPSFSVEEKKGDKRYKFARSHMSACSSICRRRGRRWQVWCRTAASAPSLNSPACSY